MDAQLFVVMATSSLHCQLLL